LNIEISKNSGFCYGVKRAVGILDDIIVNNEKKPSVCAYSLGPIIHNKQVTQYYEEKGIKVIEKLDDIGDNSINGAKCIIRSHGAPKSVYDRAELVGLELIDATCPYVKKIQMTVSNYYLKGYDIIVVGDRMHPEVIGINGWCDNVAQIIGSLSDIPIDMDSNKHYCVVAQTTFNLNLWKEIVEALGQKLPNCTVNNTICLATEQRQQACEALARRVDVMIVIGDNKSSNTKKLFEICNKIVKTIHIETKNDLDVSELIGNVKIGITAGASTPDWIIQSVVLKIENEGEVIF